MCSTNPQTLGIRFLPQCDIYNRDYYWVLELVSAADLSKRKIDGCGGDNWDVRSRRVEPIRTRRYGTSSQHPSSCRQTSRPVLISPSWLLISRAGASTTTCSSTIGTPIYGLLSYIIQNGRERRRCRTDTVGSSTITHTAPEFCYNHGGPLPGSNCAHASSAIQRLAP